MVKLGLKIHHFIQQETMEVMFKKYAKKLIKVIFNGKYPSTKKSLSSGTNSKKGGGGFQPQMGQFTSWTSMVPVKGTQFRVHVLWSKTLF